MKTHKLNHIISVLGQDVFITTPDRPCECLTIDQDEWPKLRDAVDAMLTPKCPLQEQVDAIWDLAHKSSRARSSRKQLMDKWKLHRKYAMSFELVLESLRDWNASRQWAEGYAEGIHRWVQNHRWEVEPEPARAQAPKSKGLTSFDVGI